MTTRVIQAESEWDLLRLEWNALHEASPHASLTLHFDWLRGWWRVFGDKYGKGGLRIISVRRGNQFIGAIPLYLSCGRGSHWGLRCLQFISTGEDEYEEVCPDYLNLLCQAGEEPASVPAIWREIARMKWDLMELLDIPAGSPLLQQGQADPIRVQRHSRGICPIANMAEGFEAYLMRLSPNSRQNARRLLREGERAGATFELAKRTEAGDAFDSLMTLHQERWAEDGKPGVFSAPRFVAFHRNMIKEWLPTGRAVLARLALGGVPVAVLYGFIHRRRFEFYQSGVKRDAGKSPLRSPGTLAHLLLMKALSETGVSEYDFLRAGPTSYKGRLATQEIALEGIRARRRTLRMMGHQAIRIPWKVIRMGAQRVRAMDQ